jgi:GT2 family glycosyltransferase
MIPIGAQVQELKISVVTPTFRRKEILLRHLEALNRQTLDRSRFEVVVADDGSNDGTREAVEGFKALYPLRYCCQSNRGLAATRNLGLQHASHDLILFLDDDVIPSESCLEEHLRPHLEEERVVVLGSLPYPEELLQDPFIQYLQRANHFDLFENKRRYEGGRPPLQPLNGNSSVRKDHLIEVGLYDEATFDDYGGEDVELGYRLEKAGLRWVYNPRAVGVHYHGKTYEDYLRDQRRSGRSIIKIYRKYPEIKSARKIDVLVDPWYRLRPRRLLLSIPERVSHHLPVTVAISKWLVSRLQKYPSIGTCLYPLYRYTGLSAYAEGMRDGLREFRGL